MNTKETTQAEGTASAYRRAAEDQRALKPTIKITVPSGFEWEIRPPDLQGYVMTGRLPQSLVSQFLASAKELGITPEELVTAGKPNPKIAAKLLNTLGDGEVTEMLIFMREIVRESCVNPKLVVGASAADEVDPGEVLPDDFQAIFNACMSHSGVAGLPALRTFRNRRERRIAGGKSHGKKLRRKTVAASRS